MTSHSNETIPESGNPNFAHNFESTPSTAHETPDANDSIFKLLQGSSTLSPVDGLEETTPINGTSINNTIHKVKNLFDTHPWLLWVFIAVLFLIIVGIVVLIIVCLVKHKKRVILSRGSDQNLVEYDQGGSFSLLCCRKERDHNKELVRQNSASNMDPYRRAPLPPIPARQGIGRDEKHDSGVFTLTSNKNLDPNQTINSGTLGIQITSIKGVPVIDIPKDQYRPLPNLRSLRQ
uniref:Uncharacterized protein n=1 Tax=Acrobeloides nanus TaxID=290746 RepID=A0A914D5S3_9BILA